MLFKRIKEVVRSHKALGVVPIFFIGIFVNFYQLGNPATLIFDETYHIPAAQKYLNGVFFEENHPPLGKLFIALGEKIFQTNSHSDQVVQVDKVEGEVPAINYWGYRFFPALFGVGIFVALYYLLLSTTRSLAIAYLVGLIASLDTATAVQSRAAMLDSLLVLSILLSCWLFASLWKKINEQNLIIYWGMFGLGVVNAAAVLTKHTGLIVIFPTLLLLIKVLKIKGWRRFAKPTFIWLMAFAITYLAIWKIHFNVASKVLDNNYYEVSDRYQNILDGDLKVNPAQRTLIEITEAWIYSRRYNNGVPKLDMCKTDEIGSPWYMWPFGGRAINYRWETSNGEIYRYTYLQSNPVVWGASLIGVIISTGWSISYLFNRGKNKGLSELHLVFTGLYWAYMTGIMLIDRVMYLYHYLPALFIGIVLFALVFKELKFMAGIRFRKRNKISALILILVLSGWAFWFYSPFVYNLPLSREEFEKRALLQIWGLENP